MGKFLNLRPDNRLDEDLSSLYPKKDHTELWNSLPKETRQLYIDNTWFLVPDKFINLIYDFLEFKKQYGTDIEKRVYINMSSIEFLARLYKNRPLMFINGTYMSRTFKHTTQDWEDLGNVEGELDFKDYIGYDEIALGAFLSLSIYTPFLNEGHRKNYGQIQKHGVEEKGILVGQVGACFQRQFQLEYRFMVIHPKQNTIANGYGPNNNSVKGKYLQIWAKFYDVDYFPTFDEVSRIMNTSSTHKDFVKFYDLYFWKSLYYKRTMFNAKAFLDEAEYRAKTAEDNTKAFCNVVGLGLGCWKFIDGQKDITIQVYIDLLNSGNYSHIHELYFDWFNLVESEQDFFRSKNKSKIIVSFGYRSPNSALTHDSNTKLLLVTNWAWDSAAYIGNEYWDHVYGTSGDPAAALSSMAVYIAHPDNVKKVHVV